MDGETSVVEKGASEVNASPVEVETPSVFHNTHILLSLTQAFAADGAQDRLATMLGSCCACYFCWNRYRGGSGPNEWSSD